MNAILVATAAGCALAAGLLGSAAPAAAVPTEVASVAQAIAGLQSRGYTVIVNNSGTSPLTECDMYSVRRGQTFTRMDSGFPGAGSDVITKVVSMTVYVDAHC